MTHYKAHWSRLLIVISILATATCFAAGAVLLRVNFWVAFLPLCIVFFAAPFSIVGYTMGSDEVLIHRLFWTTHLPLRDLQSFEYMPSAMRRSIRVFGNGGLFSFTGKYYNRLLGWYRAYVTDPKLTVVLRYPRQTVVLSPALPDEFVHDLQSRGQAA